MPKGGNHQSRTSKTRALAHVEWLKAEVEGLSNNHIARLAGISPSVLHASSRDRTHMTVSVEERLLAVTPRHARLLPPYRVTKGPVMAHIARLLQCDGVTENSISKAAGVSYQTMYNLRTGLSATCYYRTHVKIMSVTPEFAEASSPHCSPERAITRIRALEANRWPLTLQSEMAGVYVQSILDSRTYITRSMDRAIADFYHRVGDTVGPGDARTAIHAQRMGYRSPIHYDEDMNLIAEEYDESAPTGDQEGARLRLTILGLSLRGDFPAAITERIGEAYSPDYVVTTRGKSGLRYVKNAGEDHIVRVPGQDALVATLTDLLDGIEVTERTDVLDDPGIDYVARWAAVLDCGKARREAEAQERDGKALAA